MTGHAPDPPADNRDQAITEIVHDQAAATDQAWFLSLTAAEHAALIAEAEADAQLGL